MFFDLQTEEGKKAFDDYRFAFEAEVIQEMRERAAQEMIAAQEAIARRQRKRRPAHPGDIINVAPIRRKYY